VRAAAPPTVLVLGASPELRAALERDLAQLGFATCACTAMLEVMWSLSDPAVRHEAVIVASELAGVSLADLFAHFAEHHPAVRRLLIFGDRLAAVDHAVSRRIDSVLRTPLRLRVLSRALGIAATDSSLALLPLEE
jgi:hypothetical protein